MKTTSLSTDISAFKRMLWGDGTKRLSAAFHRLAALCNQVAFCFVSPSRHVCYLSLFFFTPFFEKNQEKFIYNFRRISDYFRQICQLIVNLCSDLQTIRCKTSYRLTELTKIIVFQVARRQQQRLRQRSVNRHHST